MLEGVGQISAMKTSSYAGFGDIDFAATDGQAAVCGDFYESPGVHAVARDNWNLVLALDPFKRVPDPIAASTTARIVLFAIAK